MANPKPKTPPKERLARILKQGSSIPELAEFRQLCRDYFRLGGVMGLYEFIDARRELNLLGEEKLVLKAADDLLGCLGSVIDAATVFPKPEKKPTLDAEERLRLINERESAARNSVAFVGVKITPTMRSRMVAAFDKLLDREIQEVRSGAPPFC